ncbi:hypothetical protein ABXS71_02635 [Bacillus infantis]|uniref:hypothetical protein n=1 Tax=Bacillus infantis TaxID=324767 RepID=UPI00344E2ADF
MNKDALEYLEEKYGKEFVIRSAESNSSSGFYSFKVYPKDEPTISFTASAYKNEKDFRDNYLKRLTGLQFQERDKPVIKNMFQEEFHSFYGNLVFFDEIVPDKDNVSNEQLLSVDPNLEHNYILFLQGEFTPTADTKKIVQFLSYLKEEVHVKKGDIDIVFYNDTPKTSAEKAYLSYIGNEDVSAVISIPPEEFQKIDTVEDFSKNANVEKMNINGT